MATASLPNRKPLNDCIPYHPRGALCPVNPEQEARVCIVAITRHGAAQAAQLAR